MKHRIGAGGLVVRDGRLLLVRHFEPGKLDFWVPPGGGVEGSEGALRGAEREVFEETGLKVRAERLAYIQELAAADYYLCKFWVVCVDDGAPLSLANRMPDERTSLVEAKFFSWAELQQVEAVPFLLEDSFWEDLRHGFPVLRHLGVHRTAYD